MNAIEIHGQNARGITLITRHYTPEDVIREYAIREAQGHHAIHKETVTLAPWSDTTCTKHPKPRRGGDRAH